jgi:catechol 2,3-dioxygenase-like lactoylglutathione lyase family enzyme
MVADGVGTVQDAAVQIGIVPRDLATSIAFYRDVLGLPYTGTLPVMEGRVLHLFAAPGGEVKLLELAVASDHAELAPSPPSPFHAATGMRWLTLDVDDLDVVAGRCAGAAWQLPVTEFRPGLRVAIVEDPDGNAIELVERR